LFVELLSRFWS